MTIAATEPSITVCMEIVGRSGNDGAVAAELVYEFKYLNYLPVLTDFENQSVNLEFSIPPSDYEIVTRFITRLKAYGLLVQTNILPP